MSETLSGLVSTIIPVYNRPEMVVTAVDSVLRQSYRPIEIILVDDGSRDDTPRVLCQLGSAYPSEIRVVHQPNGGPGLAREAGRRLARGEFMQYLDSDDLLLPDKFRVQVGALRDHPECGIAYGITRLIDSEGRTLKEPSKWTGRQFDCLFPALLIDRWWHTHTPLYRRSLSDAAGAWPKRRPEDWDLEARMGALRTRLVYCETPVSAHRDHPSANRVTRGKIEHYLRDEAWFLPRLYDCAVRSGVASDAPEMKRFSRWAFMRARYLGAIGESGLAQGLYELAVKSGCREDISMKLVSASAKIVGWKATGSLCGNIDKLRHIFDQGISKLRNAGQVSLY